MRITKKGKSAYNLRICPSFWPVWCRLTSSKSCKKVVVACLFHFILCPPFPSSTAYCVLLIQGFHCREQQNVTNRRSARQQHHKTVNADTDTACGGQAIAQCIEEVLIHTGSFVIAVRFQKFLILKALALVDGVVQLAERIAIFTSADKQLKRSV